eukprot:TRINITY_DN40879_c1_g1_i1.p1 TRINITY_DN40879_c1_g1~~TRINITY_DN40879_c1_g1_i1.p1  ORF type:complete len:106 (+),score=11.69 TRINITY_DN40879_c1_g1_i1:280-597(+)
METNKSAISFDHTPSRFSTEIKIFLPPNLADLTLPIPQASQKLLIWGIAPSHLTSPIRLFDSHVELPTTTFFSIEMLSLLNHFPFNQQTCYLRSSPDFCPIKTLV